MPPLIAEIHILGKTRLGLCHNKKIQKIAGRVFDVTAVNVIGHARVSTKGTVHREPD